MSLGRRIIRFFSHVPRGAGIAVFLLASISIPLRADNAPNLLESVDVQSSGNYAKIIIQSRRALRYKDILKDDGIYVYMLDETLSKNPSIQKTESRLVEEIRFGYKNGRTPLRDPIALDYIVIRLKSPAAYSVAQRDWVLALDLRPRGGNVSPKNTGIPRIGAPPVPRPPKGKFIPLPNNPSLQDFIQVGLANHVPLRLAEAEYGLAKWRVFEASRALFPSVSGRYEESQGTFIGIASTTLDDVRFNRREVGVQVGQPLFHSGRLYYSLRQAVMRKRSATQTVEKIRQDVSYEILKAYYNLLKSQRILVVRRELNERAEKILEFSRKKRQLELITEAEALGVESQYSQFFYKLLSEEKDMEIARLRMESLLNVPDPLPAQIPDPGDVVDPKNLFELKTPVEPLVTWALSHRPDMLSSEYDARFQDYGEKAAKAEGRLHIDASGFAGRSGGDFEKSTIELRRSWNVGVQASMSFLGNTARASRTRDKTQPDFNETSATDTNAESLSVGFLDNLKNISDRKQARIAKERAFHDRDQLKRSVDVDVREAYYNIQKARIQVRGGQLERDYRKKEAGIARQKERMNQSEPTQSIAAEAAYAEAVNNYEEAAAFYKVSLAAMEKAIGTPLDAVPELK